MSIRSNVDARALDQRIRIERKTETRDADGHRTVSWALVISCWAAVDAKKVGERWQEPEISSGVRSVSEYTVWIRADIVERYAVRIDDRVTWKGRIMDIKDMPDQQLRGRLAALIVRVGPNNG